MGIISALKRKWINGECRHICFLCNYAFGCHYHAELCKKRDNMLNTVYEYGMSNMKDMCNSRQYDKGWNDCYKLYVEHKK